MKYFFIFLFFSSLCYSQTSKEEFIAFGLQQQSNLNYSEAIEFYTKALEIDSNYIPAFINRGNVYFEQKEYSKALLDVNTVLKLDSNFTIAYNNRGLIYKFQNKFNEAIIDYDKAINLNKNYNEAYINKIRALISLTKLDEAKSIVVNLKKEFPNKSEIYLIAFVYYSVINDYSNAYKELNTAVSLNPKSEVALNERAQFRDEIQDEKGAIADYTSLISLNPKEPKYYYGRCSSNYDLKQYDKVIDDCKKTLLLDANNYSAYTMLGDVYDTYGETENSISNYEKAITIRPNLEHAYFELGKVYYLKNDLTNAIATFDRILKINPNAILSLEHRADCKGKKLDFAGSIEDYTKLISLDSKNAKYYLFKAQVENDYNKKHAACADMKKVLSLLKNKSVSDEYVVAQNYLFTNCRNCFSAKILKVNDLYQEAFNFYAEKKLDLTIRKYDEMIKIVPDSARLYYNRGKIKRELELHEEAIVDYKKAVLLDKKIVESWVAMGVSYSYLSKYDDAIKSYLEAIKVDSSYAMSYNNLAYIYTNKKETLKAIEYYEKAVEKDPNYTIAYLNLGNNYLLVNEKEKACYNYKRAESLGSIPARLKILSECN